MPKPGDIREDEQGRKFVWKVAEGSDEGWWSQVEDEDIAGNRIPWACPACNQILDDWTTSFFNRWGVCSDCYYDHLHERENLPKFCTNKDRAAYCLEKNQSKQKK